MNPSTTSTSNTSATSSSQLSSILNSLGVGSAPTTNSLDPMSSTVAFNPSNFNIPNLNSYLQQAYTSLAPYYTQILNQYQGDYNAAITELNNNYDLSTYSINAQAALSNYQTNQNLTSALQQLGVQYPQETQKLLDSLNQRGMAVTQGQPGTDPTKLNVATQGEGGYEMGSLTQDQQLRQEAVQRSAQQQQQNAALSQQTGLLGAQQSLQSGTLSQQQNLRNQQQGAEQNLESGTLSMAQNASQTAIQQQQLSQEANQDTNQFGGGGGSSLVGNNLTQSQLPSQLFNANGKTTYNGQTYNVSNNGNGTRSISIG